MKEETNLFEQGGLYLFSPVNTQTPKKKEPFRSEDQTSTVVI